MAIPTQFDHQSVVEIVEREDTLKAPLITIEEGKLFLWPFSVTIERIEMVHGQIRVKTSVVPGPGSYSPGIREVGRLDVVFSFPIVPGFAEGVGFERLSDEDIKTGVRHALHEVMKHEIDECLRNWDGSHFNDPHGGDFR